MTTGSAPSGLHLWRVLVVDDSPDDRAEIRRLLLKGSERRFEFVEAETGAAGVRAVLDADDLPDCVVLDYNLPDMDALAVLAALAGPDGLTACPVVVLTGTVGHEQTRAVLRAGAQDYLGKGWMTPESLTRAVDNVAERWVMARELREQKAALQASEDRFRLAAEAVNGIIYEYDFATGHVERTRGLYEVIGYRPNEVPPTAAWWREQTHPDDREANDRRYANLVGDAVVSEYRVRHRDGRFLHVEDRAVLLRADDGRVVKMVGCTTDVTPRKEAEAAQQKALQQLVATLESISDGFSRIDREWRVVYVNDAAERIDRRPRAETLGKTVWQLSPALIGTRVEAAYRRCVAEQVTVGFEIHYPPGDRWFAVKCDPIPAGGLVVSSRDITDIKQTADELLQSEKLLRLVVEVSGLGVTSIDYAADTSTPDATAAVLFGLAPGVPVPRSAIHDRFHPDDRAEVLRLMERSLDPTGDGTFVMDHRVVRPDGSTKWLSVKKQIVFGDVAGVRRPVSGVLAAVDITERKQAEGALRKSEARLGGILRQSPAGIVQTDAAGRMTLVNPHWCDMLGYPEAELLGRNILEITEPSFEAPTAAAFDQLAAGGPDFQIEKAYSRKDGSVLHAQSNVAALRSPAGEFLGIIAVVLDISQRLRAEEELRRLAAELSEADRRKDVFLATLAHELRNPLAPIRTGLEVLRLAGGDQKVEHIRAMMSRQVSQLVRLVDDLLDVSRITQGKIELRKERIELRAVIDAAVETSRPVIEQAGHQLTVVISDEPIFVDGDAIRLSQVVTNLLNNSAKYTHRGGHVRLTARREGETAVVSVADDGIGIPPAMLDQVFVVFTQVDRELEKSTGGLGIGLSLAKGLVQMHGGAIVARSGGEGMGSEFEVRLPVVTPVGAELDHANSPTSAAAPAGLRRILVVDDNEDAANALGDLLEMWGNDVRIANDGETAIGVAEEFRPDLVVMDIGMPQLNGYETARRIRQHPWGQGMVLVALTGWGREEDRRKSSDAGFEHHLVKPVATDALQKLLTRLKAATPELEQNTNTIIASPTSDLPYNDT